MTTHAKEHSSRNKHAGIKLGEKKIKVKFLTPVSEKGMHVLINLNFKWYTSRSLFNQNDILRNAEHILKGNIPNATFKPFVNY